MLNKKGTAGKCFRPRYGGGVVVYRFLQSIRFTGVVNEIIIIIIKRSPQTVFIYVIVPLVVRGDVVPSNRYIIVGTPRNTCCHTHTSGVSTLAIPTYNMFIIICIDGLAAFAAHSVNG